MPRLTTQIFVSALIRKASAAGGSAVVVRHGDDSAGGLILYCFEKGRLEAIKECATGLNNKLYWRPLPFTEMTDPAEIANYLAKRMMQDADLWLVELDTPESERFAEDFIATA